jgi:hypothetical protein
MSHPISITAKRLYARGVKHGLPAGGGSWLTLVLGVIQIAQHIQKFAENLGPDGRRRLQTLLAKARRGPRDLGMEDWVEVWELFKLGFGFGADDDGAAPAAAAV